MCRGRRATAAARSRLRGVLWRRARGASERPLDRDCAWCRGGARRRGGAGGRAEEAQAAACAHPRRREGQAVRSEPRRVAVHDAGRLAAVTCGGASEFESGAGPDLRVRSSRWLRGGPAGARRERRHPVPSGRTLPPSFLGASRAFSDCADGLFQACSVPGRRVWTEPEPGRAPVRCL